MKLKVTLISDTHAKHNQLGKDLPGGDLLIHAGDFMTDGYHVTEAEQFFKWFDGLDNYDTKVFIAGNHDRVMQNEAQKMKGLLTGYKNIDYLQDEMMGMYFDGPNGDFPEDNVRIYGTPWQPEFFNWAFNLPRNGDEMKAKWDLIPENTDILVTHGPLFGYLDIPGYQTARVGCEMLRYRVDTIRPKIHVFGHIHGSYGHYFNGHTHFFNAAVLNERYNYANLPWTFEWDTITNEITW